MDIQEKRKLAHDYAIEMLKRGDPEHKVAIDAYKLADEMEAQERQRTPQGLPDALRDDA